MFVIEKELTCLIIILFASKSFTIYHIISLINIEISLFLSLGTTII